MCIDMGAAVVRTVWVIVDNIYTWVIVDNIYTARIIGYVDTDTGLTTASCCNTFLP